jgi:hypothetical protein
MRGAREIDPSTTLRTGWRRILLIRRSEAIKRNEAGGLFQQPVTFFYYPPLDFVNTKKPSLTSAMACRMLNPKLDSTPKVSGANDSPDRRTEPWLKRFPFIPRSMEA